MVMRSRSRTVRRMSTAARMRMHHVPLCAAAAAVVTFVCLLRPADGSVAARAAAAADHDKTLGLFAFVLSYDRGWAPVLNQKIRLTNMGADVLPPNPVMPDVATAEWTTPLTVLRKALDEYSAFGSFIAYGAHVLRTAFGCHAHAHIMLLLDLAAAVDDECRRERAATHQNSGGDIGDEHPSEIRGIACPGDAYIRHALSVLMAIVDNAAAVHGDLDLLADAFDRDANPWGLTVEAPAGSLRDSLQTVRKAVQEAIRDKCVDMDADAAAATDVQMDRACARLGVDAPAVRQSALSAGKSNREAAENLLHMVADLLNELHNSLYVDTFPLTAWRQILNVPEYVRIDAIGSSRLKTSADEHL